jgi:Heterokaryon incompatibility protein (HET)
MDDSDDGEFSPPSRRTTGRGSIDPKDLDHLRSLDQKKIRPPPKYMSYHYDKLPRHRGAIRILRLYSSSSNNPQVECELLTPSEESTQNADFSRTIPYEALSWCWGTDPKTKYISIRKGQKTYAKYISPNLFSALRALRHHQRNRNLWIDAICINQDNLDEKNHQVEMMNKIYGNATKVCIWLGDPSKSSERALKFIKEEVLKLQDFDELCSSRAHSHKWRSLLELMQRDWFSRRWVVQEIALARRAMIYCGTDKISWSKFAVAVELFVEVETATHRLSEVMKKDPKYYHVPGWFEYVSALGASLLVDATGRLFRDYKEYRRIKEDPLANDYSQSDLDSDSDDSSESDTASQADESIDSGRSSDELGPRATSPSFDNSKSNGQPLLGLEYLVSSLGIFDTSVPHDTIYALLAIAKDTTPIAAGTDNTQRSSDHAQDVLEIFTQRKRYNVDYKAPYVDVCKDFIIFCIERNLQVEPSRALDVICRPWATEQKVLEAKRRAEEKEKQKRAKYEKRRDRRTNRQPKKSPNSTTEGPVEAEEPRTKKPVNRSLVIEKSSHKHGDPLREAGKAEDSDAARYMELPSWIPQLSGAPYAMFSQPGAAGIKMSRKNADPLVGLPSITQRNYAAAETKSIDMKSLKFRKRVDLEHFSMYVKGFVLDTVVEVSQLSRNGQIPQEWAELADWPGADGNPPDAFWRTVVADRGRDGKNPPVYYSRACKESFMKGGYMGGAVNTTDLINYERNSVVAQFCRRVQAVIWNRALIKTQSGTLGLVGRHVQQGDRVGILYGCSVPVILRRSEQKDEATFREEIVWELNFLTDTLRKYFKRWQKRRKEHKERKEEAKWKFFRWEVQKWKQFRRDKTWRDKWREELGNQAEAERKAGLKIAREYDLPPKPDLDNQRNSTARTEAIKYLKVLIWNKDLRLSREFKAWKRVKTSEAKRDENRTWLPPVPDWREFELRLKYGRFWKKRIKTRKRELREKIEEAVTKKIEAQWQDDLKKRSQAQKAKAQLPEASSSRASIVIQGDPRRLSVSWSTREEPTEQPKAIKETVGLDGRANGPRGSKNAPGIDTHVADAKSNEVSPSNLLGVDDKGEAPTSLRADDESKQIDDFEALHPSIEKEISGEKALSDLFTSIPISTAITTAQKEGSLAIDEHQETDGISDKLLSSRSTEEKANLANRTEHILNKDGTIAKGRPPIPAKAGSFFHQRSKSSPESGQKKPSANSVVEQQNTDGYRIDQDQPKKEVEVPKTNGQQRNIEQQTKSGLKIPAGLAGLFDGDQDESESEDEAWKDDTWKAARELKKGKQASGGTWKEAEWTEYWKTKKELDLLKEEKRDTWKDANWKQYREEERIRTEQQLRERLGEVVVENGKERRRLTNDVKRKYNRQIGKNFRKALGEDGYYYYTLLGECYIHGMMDGEAVAYQNGKNPSKEVVPTTTFEIR